MSSSPISGKPIFIVGAARSGTTLLQYMLRSHPEVSLPTAESHFFIPFYQRRHEFGDLTDITNLRSLLKEIYMARKLFFDEDMHGIRFNPDEMAHLLHNQVRSTIPDIISGIFMANARAEGKDRWGDKTPYYILHLETILEMFPDAQIVHIIRDGRDCALSMLERKWDLQIFNIYHSAYIWERYVSAGRRFGTMHPECYFEIRYEDILNQPVASMESLCKFLEIEYSDSVINFKKSDGSGKTPLLTKPLQKSNQAKWKRKMSEKQVAVFESLAGKALKESGYNLMHKSPSISPVDWFFFETHIRMCFFYRKYLR